MFKLLLFIFFFILGVNNQVYAEPISIGIAISTTFFGGSIFAFAATVLVIKVAIVATIGFAIYSSVRAAQQADKLNIEGSKYTTPVIDNTFSNEGIVPILYGGPIIMGGNLLWQSDPGETVHRFLGICIGEITSISNVKLDDQDIAGLDGCSYTAYLGTSSQAVDSRGSGIVKGLRDVAYIAVTMTRGEKVGSNPVITSEAIGRKIQTWNVGTSSWATNALITSKNPAAIIRDYMLLSRVLGGCGVPEEFIDPITFGDFFTHCAELVDNGAGGTEARYELDIAIDTKHSALDNLDKLLVTCNAKIIRSGCLYKIAFEKSGETAVMAFTEDNITKGTFIYGYGKTDAMPNKVGVEWISALESSNSKRVAWAEDELDQDIRGAIEDKIECYGIIRQSQASRLANKFLYEGKLADIWCEFECNMSAMHCEPFDVVSVTHSRPNWTAAAFRIIETTELDFGKAKFTLQAYNSSILADRHGSTFDDWNYGSPPNPFAPVTDVTNIVLEEIGWRNADGTHIAHIDVTWVAPATKKELLNGYIIELKKGAGDYISVGTANVGDTEYRINLNLEIDKEYYVKIKTQSINSIISDGTVSSVIKLIGKDDPPSNVTSFIVRKYRDSIVCRWGKVTDVDVKRYEIRKGADWISADVVGTNLPGVEATLRDIKLGTDQAYWIKAIDNSDNYSVNALEALITVANIPFQNIIKTFEEDPAWNGTKTDTEISGNNLILSAGKLTGTYITAVKGIGYICDARIMIESLATIASALAWNSEAGRAFDDSTTLRFSGDEVPGALSFKIRTSTEGADPLVDTWTDWEDWITADYNCRWFQIKMTVTRDSVDTSLAVTNLTIDVDLPDIDEKDTGEVTNAADGCAITFTKTFHEAPSVNIDILDGDGYVHKFSVAPTTTGFTVKLYKLDGTAVVGNFSYHAHGI